MTNLVKRALTHRRQTRGRQPIIEEPDERLVLGVEFAIAMAIILSCLEIVSMVCLQTWNSEIFAAITCLTGTIVGLFVGKKV